MKEVIMPKFGFTQDSAEIVDWLVQPGERVEKGQPIAEVTTDKVNMEVEAPDTGILGGVRYQKGVVVPVTAVIAYILAPGETAPGGQAEASAAAEFPASEALQAAPTKVQVSPVAARVAEEKGIDPSLVSGSGPGGRVLRKDVEAFLVQPDLPEKVRAVPAARRLARELGLEMGALIGSGPRGRLQSSDVQAAYDQIAKGQAQPSMDPETTPSAPGQQSALTPLREVIPLVGMRRTIAERLQKSAQEAPHITFDINVDVTAAEGLRARANRRLDPGQGRVSLTAVIAKSVAWALERNPLLNAWLLNGPQGQEIHVLDQVNLGIAVALDVGLIVPVVFNAGSKGILQLSAEINDRAERARSGKLRPEDVVEGTFTLSNLGMFGIDRFTAIINPPQVAILAASRISKHIIADENDQPVARPIMALTLSADHRIVDGAVAARFMADLREALENPECMAL